MGNRINTVPAKALTNEQHQELGRLTHDLVLRAREWEAACQDAGRTYESLTVEQTATHEAKSAIAGYVWNLLAVGRPAESPADRAGGVPDPLGCNACQHPECGRFEGPRQVECRAMADNACARPERNAVKGAWCSVCSAFQCDDKLHAAPQPIAKALVDERDGLQEEIQRLAQMADAATHQSPADMRNIMEDLAEGLTRLLATAPQPSASAQQAAPQAGSLVRFVTYLADHCEGQIINEEALQGWLADLLDDVDPLDTPAKQTSERILVASAAPAPSASPDQAAHRRFMANEWADVATNGLQWLRNIAEGVSKVEDALANMEECVSRVMAQQDAGPAAAPSASPAAQGVAHEDVVISQRVEQALSWIAEGETPDRHHDLDGGMRKATIRDAMRHAKHVLKDFRRLHAKLAHMKFDPSEDKHAELIDAEIDKHLDAVLHAAGSSLRNYTMQRSLDNMRTAMRAAIAKGEGK